MCLQEELRHQICLLCGNCFEIRDEMYTRSQKEKIMTSSSPNYMLEQSMFLLISSISPNILSSASWYALKLFHPWNSKFLHISYRRVSFQHGYDTFNSCDISTRSQAFYLTIKGIWWIWKVALTLVENSFSYFLLTTDLLPFRLQKSWSSRWHLQINGPGNCCNFHKGVRLMR